MVPIIIPKFLTNNNCLFFQIRMTTVAVTALSAGRSFTRELLELVGTGSGPGIARVVCLQGLLSAVPTEEDEGVRRCHQNAQVKQGQGSAIHHG